MDILRLDRIKQPFLKTLPLHKNLLNYSAEPELLDADGVPFSPKTGSLSNVVKPRTLEDKRHVQLHAKLPITVTYTLNADWNIEKILLATFSGNTIDFGFGRYEIYFSNSRETLYDKHNLIGVCDRRKQENENADSHPGSAQMFVLSETKQANYFGIRFTHGCALDTVVRLDMVGLFAPYDFEKHKEYCRIGSCITDIPSTIEGKKETFCFKMPINFNTLLVKDTEAPVLWQAQNGEWFPINEKAVCYNDIWRIDTDCTATALRSETGNIIGAFCNKVTAKIKTDKIINSDFLGVGTNVLPVMLMEESIKTGYDPKYLELEKEAIRTLQPPIIRVWFQNDWFQTAPDTYDFSSPKMQAFLEYMEIFRELKTEIELDFTFAVGSSIHSWYCIPEVADQGRSAPRDLNQFARSVVAALRFLCDEKGYLVKYITISNEPNGPNFAVAGDEVEKKKTYAAALRAIDTELKKANMRERFEIWGFEDAFLGDLTWLKDIHNFADDVIDRYSEHFYFTENDTLKQNLIPQMKQIINGKPLCMTEFGNANSSYKKSNIGCLIAAVNSGVDTALHWCLTNAVLADPLLGGKYDEPICLYRNHEWKNEGLYIENICAELGAAMRYIPPHCTILETETDNPDDIRLSVFAKGDDVTILVEASDSGVRDLILDLGNLTDKPFYKYASVISTTETPDALLPPCQPINASNGILCDRLEAAHRMILYTTCK